MGKITEDDINALLLLGRVAAGFLLLALILLALLPCLIFIVVHAIGCNVLKTWPTVERVGVKDAAVLMLSVLVSAAVGAVLLHVGWLWPYPQTALLQ